MYQELINHDASLATTPLNHPVTPEMVYARTLQLATNEGRNSHEIRQADYERAKRELTGETDFDRQQAMLGQNSYR